MLTALTITTSGVMFLEGWSKTICQYAFGATLVVVVVLLVSGAAD